MKISTLTILLFLAVSTACCQKKIQTIKINCLSPYCGGARPSKEMIAESEKPKPYADKKVILVSATGKVDSATTDKDGNIKRKLKPGPYKLYEPWRYYKKNQTGEKLSNYDKECLATEWKKPFMVVIVSKTTLTQKSEGPIMLYCEWDAPCLLDSIKVQRRPE